MESLSTILILIGGIIGLLFIRLIIKINKKRPKFTRKGFTPLEKGLLTEFFNLFEPDLSKKLEKQIEYLEPKRKWRQYWPNSMSMELYGDNKNELPEDLRYNRRDESTIAIIRFSVNNKKYSIEFDNYNGRLWGWSIRPNPKHVMRNTSAKVISQKIHSDLNSFALPTFKKKKYNTIPIFKGVLNELAEYMRIKESFYPMDSELLEMYTKQIPTKLPEGYLEIIKQSEGLILETFRILGASEIYRTRLDGGNYYHLVEFDDGIIAIREGEETGKLFYCHYSGIVDELSTDFEKELIEKMPNTTSLDGK